MGTVAIPSLAELLKDETPRNRKNAILLLGEIGAASNSVIQMLRDTTNDESSDVRQAATEVLSKITKSED